MKYPLKYRSDAESVQEYVRQILELVSPFAHEETEILRDIRKELRLPKSQISVEELGRAQERGIWHIKKILEKY